MKLKNVVTILSISTLLASCGKQSMNNDAGGVNANPATETKTNTSQNEKNLNDITIEEARLQNEGATTELVISELGAAATIAVGGAALVTSAKLENILRAMAQTSAGVERKLLDSYLTILNAERSEIANIKNLIKLTKENHAEIEDRQIPIKNRIKELETQRVALVNKKIKIDTVLGTMAADINDNKVVSTLIQEQADSMGGEISKSVTKIESLTNEANKLSDEIDGKMTTYLTGKDAAAIFDQKSAQLKSVELRVVDETNSLEALKAEGDSAKKIASMEKQLQNTTARRDRLSGQLPVVVDVGAAKDRLDRIRAEISTERQFVEYAKAEQTKTVQTRKLIERNTQESIERLGSDISRIDATLKEYTAANQDIIRGINNSATYRQANIDRLTSIMKGREAKVATIHEAMQSSLKGKTVRLFQKIQPKLRTAYRADLHTVKAGIAATGAVLIVVGAANAIEAFDLYGERVEAVGTVK